MILLNYSPIIILWRFKSHVTAGRSPIPNIQIGHVVPPTKQLLDQFKPNLVYSSMLQLENRGSLPIAMPSFYITLFWIPSDFFALQWIIQASVYVFKYHLKPPYTEYVDVSAKLVKALHELLQLPRDCKPYMYISEMAWNRRSSEIPLYLQ